MSVRDLQVYKTDKTDRQTYILCDAGVFARSAVSQSTRLQDRRSSDCIVRVHLGIHSKR